MTTYECWSISIQIIGGTAAFATLYIYFRQLRIMSRQLIAMQESSKAQSGLSLVNFIQSQEVREARDVVRRILSKKSLENWSSEDRKNAALVVANYDVAAALIRAGLAPVDLVTANWGPSIRHCHQVLQPFMAEQRGLPGSGEQYWSNFDWLSDQVIQKQV